MEKITTSQNARLQEACMRLHSQDYSHTAAATQSFRCIPRNYIVVGLQGSSPLSPHSRLSYMVHCIEHGTLLYRGRNLRQKVYIRCPLWAYSFRHTRSGQLIWAHVPQNLAGDVSTSVKSRSLTVFHRYLVLAVQ